MSLSTILLVLFVLLCVGGVILSFVLRVERSPKIVASVSGTAGSVGQPKDGDPSASYAVWEDGQINLR